LLAPRSSLQGPHVRGKRFTTRAISRLLLAISSFYTCGSRLTKDNPGHHLETMKIESVTLREIQMPLVHFFETSFGRIYSRRILLVSVEADGVRGWGECVAGEDPYYSPEWTETAWPTIKHYLAPLLMQGELDAGRDCAARFARVRCV